jgi:hypothetical protein
VRIGRTVGLCFLAAGAVSKGVSTNNTELSPIPTSSPSNSPTLIPHTGQNPVPTYKGTEEEFRVPIIELIAYTIGSCALFGCIVYFVNAFREILKGAYIAPEEDPRQQNSVEAISALAVQAETTSHGCPLSRIPEEERIEDLPTADVSQFAEVRLVWRGEAYIHPFSYEQ